jgi:hypothetical protein
LTGETAKREDRRHRPAKSRSAKGGNRMIVEIRTYAMHPGKTGAWLDYYEKNGLPVQLRMLGKLIFMGSTEIGPLNQVVHVWTYNSLAEREQKRAAMGKDPAWHAYLKNAPPGMIVSQESKILNPAGFSPLK